MDTEYQWRQSLQPGDLVIQKVGMLPRRVLVAIVSRVTKAYIFTECGRKYRKRDGQGTSDEKINCIVRPKAPQKGTEAHEDDA